MKISSIMAVFKKFKRKRSTKEKRISLTVVWYIEATIGVACLIAILYFDWRVFDTLVAATPKFPQEELKNVVVLDERAVKRGADAIAEKQLFIDNPTPLPLINDPF